MSNEPKLELRVVAAYLDDVADELEAVRRLAAPPSVRLAAFHLQQAAEKLVKAIRLKNAMPATAEHNLERLIAELPETEIWRERLTTLEWLSAYATTYRYPTPAGRRSPGPDSKRVLATADEILRLLESVRAALA